VTKKVAIIVDDIVRDLIPLTLLAIELRRKNLKPYLVPARLQVLEIRKIKPDFIIINYLRKENEEIVQYYKNSGVAVGLLDQEGGAFIDYQKFEEIKLSKNLDLRNSIDLVFAWGENFYNEARKRLWFKKDSLIIKEEEIKFIITDFNNELNISFSGTVPNLFSEEKGVVAEGKLQDKTFFIADRILAKHDENYMPPELKDIMKKNAK